MMPLEKELAKYGSDIDPARFNSILAGVFKAEAKGRTTEAFANHLDEAKAFCRTVRKRVGKNLPDEMIMRRLHNLRKTGVAVRAG